MGQYWNIINLDTMEDLECLGKLGESLWGDHNRLIKRMCFPPQFPDAPVGLPGLGKLVEGERTRPTTFAHIPPEIISEIFEYIKDYTDCLYFASTCSRVWSSGQRVLERRYLQHHAPYIGARLICIGDYARDLPDQLNNARDLSRLSKLIEQWGSAPDSDDEEEAEEEEEDGGEAEGGDADEEKESEVVKKTQKDEPSFFARLLAEERELRLKGHPAAIVDDLNIIYSEVKSEETRTEWSKHLRVLAWKIYRSYGERWDRHCSQMKRSVLWAESRTDVGGPLLDWDMGIDVRRNARSYETPTAGPITKSGDKPRKAPVVMVLRNHTKKQFVRSDTFAVNGNDEVWGFGKAIVSRICWSTDNSCAMMWDGEIHRGVWAGDAFDVVPLHRFFSEETGIAPDGWSDVTQEVRKELIEIWKSEFGDDWEANAW